MKRESVPFEVPPLTVPRPWRRRPGERIRTPEPQWLPGPEKEVA